MSSIPFTTMANDTNRLYGMYRNGTFQLEAFEPGPRSRVHELILMAAEGKWLSTLGIDSDLSDTGQIKGEVLGMPLWMTLIEWINRMVLAGLFGLSIWSVTVILNRRRHFQGTTARSLEEQLIKLIKENPTASPAQLDRLVQACLQEQRILLERGLSTLATLGSNAPFVGLFGTVLGIIQAFGVLSLQRDSGAQVMGAVAEALVATAIGLFVAIPAVVAYNTFSTQMRELFLECEVIKDRLIAPREK